MGIFEIQKCKFSVSFSKKLAKTERIVQKNLKSRIKSLEQNFKNEDHFYAYNLCKLELENINDKKTEGTKIRSRCEWYQHAEKPDKVLFESWETKSYKYNSKTLNW